MRQPGSSAPSTAKCSGLTGSITRGGRKPTRLRLPRRREHQYPQALIDHGQHTEQGEGPGETRHQHELSPRNGPIEVEGGQGEMTQRTGRHGGDRLHDVQHHHQQ
jgi:hypothetical protein